MEKKILRVLLRVIYLTGIDNEGTVYWKLDVFTILDSSNFSLFEALRRKYGHLTFYSRERLPIYIYTNFNLALACRSTTTCLHEFTAISPGRLCCVPLYLGEGWSICETRFLWPRFLHRLIPSNLSESVVSTLAFKFSSPRRNPPEKEIVIS